MFRLAGLVVSSALFVVVGAQSPSWTAAQDASPAAGPESVMSVDETHAVLDPYLAALTAREDIAPFFADDVLLTLVEVGQEIRGRDAVASAIQELHTVTFDARPEVVSLVVSEGTAAGEFVFVGTHTGEFAGIPATGREVVVPYTVFYDIADGEITALRIYGFASGLMAQIAADEVPTPGTPEVSATAATTIALKHAGTVRTLILG